MSSTRISKELSERIADKLTAEKKIAIDLKNKTLNETFAKYYESTLPKDVVEFFAKHPNYCNSRSSMQLVGNGFNWNYFGFGKELPATKSTFSPDEKTAKVLLDLENEINDLKKERRDLRNEISNALYSLRTFNRIRIEFPEAAEFLPANGTTALAINLADIRSKLK